MATDYYTVRKIFTGALKGFLLIALGCGFQALFAPTVQVTCPARTAPEAPDCEMRWLAAFDMITVRRVSLPALQPVGEIVSTAPSRQGGATTLFLNTSTGPVRTIMWGDHLSLQRDLRDPFHAYFAGAQAPAIALTMWPSRWVDPGGNAANRMVRRAHPVRLVANGLVVVGLLFWIWLPVQIVVVLARWLRA